MLDRLNDVLEWVCDYPGNTTLEIGMAVLGTAHGHTRPTLYNWAKRRLYKARQLRLVTTNPSRPRPAPTRWALTKKGKQYVDDIKQPDAKPPELTEVQLIIRWMERGCPVYLVEGDEWARPLGDCRTAAECYKRGLAALDGIIMFGGHWKRDWRQKASA